MHWQCAIQRAAEPTRTGSQLAYAGAMQSLADRYAGDADIAVLAAEAAMNAHAYDYWRANGRPQPWTPKIIAWLDQALSRGTSASWRASLPNPFVRRFIAARTGACVGRATWHAGSDGRSSGAHAVAYFFQIGTLSRGVASNEAAVRADREYAEATGGGSDYAIHNLHYLWVSALWSGDDDTAVRAATELAAGGRCGRNRG